VYFTAGLDHETHGLFGSLTSVAPGSPEGPAEEQAVVAAVDVFQIDLAKLETDLTTPGVTKATIKQDIQTVNADLVALVHAESRFAADTRADQGHHGDHDGDAAAEAALDKLFAELGKVF
jgi:hypothetical protein